MHINHNCSVSVRDLFINCFDDCVVVLHFFLTQPTHEPQGRPCRRQARGSALAWRMARASTTDACTACCHDPGSRCFRPRPAVRLTAVTRQGTAHCLYTTHMQLHDRVTSLQGPPRKIKDEDLLGEMLFGSIPMTFDQPTTKIHEIKTDGTHVMISHVLTSFGHFLDDGTAADVSLTRAVRFGPSTGTSYSALISGYREGAASPHPEHSARTIQLPSDCRCVVWPSAVIAMPLSVCCISVSGTAA